MSEMKNIEYKLDKTNTYLKTVSAYSNYDGGQIIFGADNDGNVVGLPDVTQFRLDIENSINDNIKPQPNYELIPHKNKTVTLIVKPGRKTPYMYKGKAYKRNDTATIEVDELELSRLILKGQNVNYEDLPASRQDLTFTALEIAAKREMGISSLNKDILKTLNLYSEQDGYSKVAELFADCNNFPGIDIVKYGENISIIEKRVPFANRSILSELDKAVEIYRDYYQFEEVKGMERTRKERIPEEAFREAIANALMHRTWDVNAQIRIWMFDDRVEIYSPGGLLSGISEQEYLGGNVSILRNPKLGAIFFRLHIVEMLGTGIRRIKDAYQNSSKAPIFEIMTNSIKLTLPVIDDDALSEDEKVVYKQLSKSVPKSISEIMNTVPFGKSKTTKLLQDMAKKNQVKIEGNGRGTKYRLP